MRFESQLQASGACVHCNAMAAVELVVGTSAALLLWASAIPTALADQGSATAPDITGYWSRYPDFSDPRPDPKLLPPPPGRLLLKPPYAGPYKAMRDAEQESDRRGEPLASSGTKCLPYGMPEMMFAIYPLEILQIPGEVTIIGEAMTQVRRIYLNEPQLKIGDEAPGYYGHSIGQWKGDTLVVDTIGVKTSVRGHEEMPHSDQMHITEHFQLLTPDMLYDQITVNDPVVLQQPWTFTFAYKRLHDYEMQEYVCDDNREYVDDKGVEHLRVQDVKP
jgi:hypothetical protein